MSELLLSAGPGQTLFLFQIQEGSIRIIPFLEMRKWTPSEATQPIKGRSGIWIQIPKLFPLDHAMSAEYKGVTDMRKGTLT